MGHPILDGAADMRRSRSPSRYFPMPATELAVAIPCRNEAENLADLLPRLREVLEDLGVPFQIYILDGGSVDATMDVARSHGARVLSAEGPGYGQALRRAFQDIDAPWIATLDPDFSHHPAFLKYLFAQRDRADILIASRYAPGGYARMPWLRRWGSKTLNVLLRTALSVPVRDLSSGFRLYRRKVARRLKLKQDGFAILQESLVKAYCLGYEVREIPFHYQPVRIPPGRGGLEPGSRRQPVGYALDSLRVLARLWRVRNSIQSADYDSRAFYSRIPLQRWWQRRRYEIILSYVGDRARVLDAGCGSTQILNGAPQMVGMDIRLAKLRFMRRPGRPLVQGSVFDLPFRDGAFEVVVCSQVIEHLPEDPSILRELVRVLEPGGSLILGTPDYGTWKWPLIEKAYGMAQPGGYADEHITHYTREGLTRGLREIGLTIEGCQAIAGAELVIHARKPERRDGR